MVGTPGPLDSFRSSGWKVGSIPVRIAALTRPVLSVAMTRGQPETRQRRAETLVYASATRVTVATDAALA